jgi:hypothetical protein
MSSSTEWLNSSFSHGDTHHSFSVVPKKAHLPLAAIIMEMNEGASRPSLGKFAQLGVWERVSVTCKSEITGDVKQFLLTNQGTLLCTKFLIGLSCLNVLMSSSWKPSKADIVTLTLQVRKLSPRELKLCHQRHTSHWDGNMGLYKILARIIIFVDVYHTTGDSY